MGKKEIPELKKQISLFDEVTPYLDPSTPVNVEKDHIDIEYVDIQNQMTFEFYQENQEELTSYLPSPMASIQRNEATALASKIMALILISVKEKQGMNNVPNINTAIRLKIHQAYKILGKASNERMLDAVKDLKNLSYMSVSYNGSVKEPDTVEAAPLFQYIIYHQGTISVILNPITNNLWMNLSKGYTPILLKQAMAFGSKYSFGLYNLIAKSRNKPVDISYKELRKLLGVNNAYPEWKEFKRSVLGVAIKEINKKSNRIIEIKVISGLRNPDPDAKICRVSGRLNWDKAGEYKDLVLKAFSILDLNKHYNSQHIADYAISNPLEFINKYNYVIQKYNLGENYTDEKKKAVAAKLYKELGIN